MLGHMDGFNSAMSWAQNQEIVYSNLQSITQQRELLDQITGAQKQLIGVQARSQLEQLGLRDAGADIRKQSIEFEKGIAENQFEEQKRQDAERFGASMGQLRARAAANGIELAGSFQGVQSELTNRFNRQQITNQKNFNLQQRIRDNQIALIDLDKQSTAVQMKSVSQEAGLQMQLTDLRSQSRAAAMDAQIRNLHIKRKYAIESGSAAIAGSVISAQGAKVNFPF